MPQNGQPEPTERDLTEAAESLIALKETQGWKLLMVRLQAEAYNATIGLVDVDAHDAGKIESLQREVKRLNWFSETIEILIDEGLGNEQLEQQQFPDA